MMLNGSEGQKMLDNMTVSADGIVTIVEDVGNNAFLGRVLQYNPTTDTLAALKSTTRPASAPPPTPPFTQDEEASGVIDVTSILRRTRSKSIPHRHPGALRHRRRVGRRRPAASHVCRHARSGGSGNDVIKGSGFADDLSGGGGDDTMTTGGGNDVIDGGSGSDIMAGGAGDDAYLVDNGLDVVTENASAGSDTVYSTAHLALAANVENLVLLGSADLQGYGNSLSNAIYGNAGSNLLDGAGGADGMLGGAGNDVYFVDNAGDGVVENVGEGTDAVFSTAHFALSANVEALLLQGSADLRAAGNCAAPMASTAMPATISLDGGAGADMLTGNAGNDAFLFNVGQGDGDMIVDFTGNGAAAGNSC